MMRAQSGPFLDRPYYGEQEIEEIAAEKLGRVDLIPTAPEPIRVDRFIEKRFGIVPQYEYLPAGTLGYTQFGATGPEKVVVSQALSEEGRGVAERRVNSTLAHEAGHILLHSRLFALQRRAESHVLFENGIDENRQTILCRSSTVGPRPEPAGTYGYDGRWWEYQANMVIGALLLPRRLVSEALESLLASHGRLGIRRLDDAKRVEAVRRLANLFDVNPAVARIRVDGLFPATAKGQLPL